MKKVKNLIVIILTAIFFLAIGINSYVRVGYGFDKPSKGIIMYWLTE